MKIPVYYIRPLYRFLWKWLVQLGEGDQAYQGLSWSVDASRDLLNNTASLSANENDEVRRQGLG